LRDLLRPVAVLVASIDPANTAATLGGDLGVVHGYDTGSIV
jgi:hypothetical protein